MYLKKLEIFGFKSFANRTVLNFSHGITGIVGPNGCGKSNIVDAIRWSLGEQKSSTLRSEKMESVIFNGTKTKKPMGMAEVSLTMMNEDNVLPMEFSEVTITRRIFRSGETEYLLNKNQCRLKDIINLFMDTGMASNAYSVIELKMIEIILSNKAEERRQMFEEAAGVKKYKLRRRLALKKLEEVQTDFTRIKDIVSEVEKKVATLERQAKKADKYNEIKSKLENLELELSERQFALFNRKKTSLIKEQDCLTGSKEEIDGSIRSVEGELLTHRSRMSGIEAGLYEQRKELSAVTEKLHNIQKNISVSEERKRSQKINLERLRKEINDFQEELGNLQESIETNGSLISDLRVELNAKSATIASEEKDSTAAKARALETRLSLEKKQAEIFDRFKELTRKENGFFGMKKSLEKTDAKIEFTKADAEKLRKKTEIKTEELRKLRLELQEMKERLKGQESLYGEQTSRKEKLEASLASVREEELSAKSSLRSLKDKIEFIEGLLQNLEGVSKAGRKLLKEPKWTKKEKMVFADAGSSDETHKRAIESALSETLNSILIESYGELKTAYEFLSQGDLGKASFFLLQETGKKSEDTDSLRKSLEGEKAFAGWALDFVKPESGYAEYFRQYLSDSCITENLEGAIELSEKYRAYNFVTLQGDLIRSNGSIRAGSVTEQDSLFGRRRLLSDLKKEMPKLQEQLTASSQKTTGIELELSGINPEAIRVSEKRISNEIRDIEKKISQIEFENTRASEEIERLKGSEGALINEKEELGQKIKTLSEEIESKKAEKNSFDRELAVLKTEETRASDALSKSALLLSQERLEAERIRSRLSLCESSLKRAAEQKERNASSILQRNEDIKKSIEELSALERMIEDGEAEYEGIFLQQDELSKKEQETDSLLTKIKAEASRLEARLSQLRGSRQNISEKMHEIGMQINELSLREENLTESIREDYELELELKEFNDLDNHDIAPQEKEVSGLKTSLKNLGPINLLAYEEYREEKGRLDFLMKQRQDLSGSQEDLLVTINEINQTAQQLFTETFSKIKTNFKKIFQTVFNPGDEADLLIEDDVDPLEAKIEIVAKPKGKRPTNIELLSGGEKTLTAIALLFSIYLEKPSPFCILDEVDAPLDDSNLGRFIRLIQEFSGKTQFIIITHNKLMMEAAENMYGVTMQEEGISKLAGVNFNDQIKITA